MELILRMKKENKERHPDAKFIEVHLRAKKKGLGATGDEPPSSTIGFTHTAMVGLKSQPNVPLTRANPLLI